MTKVAIYARVSTEEQTVDNQIAQLVRFAETKGWQLAETYTEAESAWKAGHQKELARAIDDARLKKFDVLLIWALDRMSREGASVILQLYKRFESYKVQVVSLQESWTEYPSEFKDVLLAFVGWVAQMESKRRSERTKAGMARVKASGKKLGRPKGLKDSYQRSRPPKFTRKARPVIMSSEN